MAAANYAPAASMASTSAPGAAGHQLPVSNGPPGTFAPGTKVQVGGHRVVIEKYLSEGGFAHVYVVRNPVKDNKYELAVLKRVAVPDKEALASMRTEVETMKKLKGHKHIVRYIDSHASQLKGGGYEVFLLMEFCAGGGLIDFMNTRLQYRLTEPEILNIFSDVAEGVATMHYLKPPLLHRDLKVENVLISKPPSTSSNALYKLCDFGSTAPPRPAATTTAEARLIEDDIQRHTTMQYRSPEMVDVWRKQPIDEKSDIWALGVLLYKLCYYTTPFEEVGQMAILNAKFKFPHHPFFSQRLRGLISAMLKEDPKQRPNIFQVVQEVCNIRGTPCPIKDIYSQRSSSEDAKNRQLPPTSPQVKSPPSAVGISHSPPKQTKEALPDITPMRRGRPTSTLKEPTPSKPAPKTSPARGDPFAALDSSNMSVRTKAVDALSNKYPSLDEFSIVQDKRAGYNFTKSASSSDVQSQAVSRGQGEKALPPLPKSTGMSASAVSAVASDPKPKPVPIANPKYVSTGTMTTTTPPPQKPKPYPDISARPIWKVPTHNRSESQPRPATAAEREKAPIGMARSLQPSPAPERQQQRDPEPDEADRTTARKLSDRLEPRPRPASSSFVGSNLSFLRDHEESLALSPPSMGSRKTSSQRLASLGRSDEVRPTTDDTAYLRDLEKDDDQWEHDQLNPSRGSPTKDVDVLARQYTDSMNLSRETSPVRKDLHIRRALSPVASSDATATPTRSSTFDTSGLEELEDLPPEMRREMERQQALDEERRVMQAASQYRNKQSTGLQNASRASTIQQRVQSLLDEGRAAPVQRTAAGYGRYTDTREDGLDSSQVVTSAPARQDSTRSQPVQGNELSISKTRTESRSQPLVSPPPVSSSAPPANRVPPPRPSAKPKPMGLRSTTTGLKPSPNASPVTPTRQDGTSEWRAAANTSTQGSRLAALLARDQEGSAEAGAGTRSEVRNDYEAELLDTNGSSADHSAQDQDWELDFSRRFPSLGKLELVETDILPGQRSRNEVRIKDV